MARVETTGSIDPTVTPALVPTDVTAVIAIVVIISLAVFIAFILYLAFGPHTRSVETAAPPIDSDDSSEPEREEETDADAAGGDSGTEEVDECSDSTGD